MDPGLARDGLLAFRELPRSATRFALLCTDLHAGNVLSGQRRPWLLIDPKPYLGDPHYDVLQHLLNCNGRLQADPLGLVLRMSELTGLDAERSRDWTFARCVQEGVDSPHFQGVARRLAR
jgi:streptomycin 6-kinase